MLRYSSAGAAVAFLAACGVSGTADNAQGGGSSDDDVKSFWDNAKETDTLNFSNWDYYIDRSILKTFTKRTGIDVTYRTDVVDNNPFLARIIPDLQAGNYTGRDLIVITNGGPVERMIKLGYLVPLDHDLLPNFNKNASVAVKNPSYDPGNKYTTAWQSGFTAIAYNSKYVKEPPRTFGDLLNATQYKGKVGMLGNAQDLACPALTYLGYDIQESTPDQWRKAAQLLEKQRDQGIVRSYYGQPYITAFENGDTLLTQCWSGDIFIANAPKSVGGDGFPELKLNLPEEGGILWTDNMCIPKYAENPLSAIKMMDFVYEPEIAAILADYIWYVSPVPAAKDIVLNKLDDPLVANSQLVFPSQSSLAKAKKYRVFKDSDEEEEWNSIFEPIFSG
jgi:spermidine/putrescine transport system substrate-binding protein